MKTETELNKEIIETTIKIQQHYPELSKFEEEMTITIPSEIKPEITTSSLQDYKDSLQAMAKGYAKNRVTLYFLD